MSTLQMLPQVLPNLAEKAVGLTKEVVGTLIDRDDLREQGQAQQKKAEERLEAFRRELEADRHRAGAAADERRQRSHQSGGNGGASETGKGGAGAAGSAAAEKLKGTVKSAAGSLVGNEDMRKEGQAQQDKAAEEANVSKEEAKAEEARAKANAAERKERAASRG